MIFASGYFTSIGDLIVNAKRTARQLGEMQDRISRFLATPLHLLPYRSHFNNTRDAYAIPNFTLLLYWLKLDLYWFKSEIIVDKVQQIWNNCNDLHHLQEFRAIKRKEAFSEWHNRFTNSLAENIRIFIQLMSIANKIFLKYSKIRHLCTIDKCAITASFKAHYG